MMHTARRVGDLVHLEDTSREISVSLVTSLGNLAYRMRVRGHDILYFPFSSVEEFAANPTGWYGISLLAPWANRLDEQAFYANGRRYELDMHLGNVTGHFPMHGFLSSASQWEVTALSADADAAWVTSRLEVFRQPDWMKQWPFAHTMEMTHRLQEGVMEVTTRILNHSAEPMPVVIGFHPYFQLTDSPRETWTIAIPARTRWLLCDRLLPTGQTESTGSFFPNGGGLLDDYNLDDVFSGLDRDEQGLATASVRGRTQQVDVVFGPAYRGLVIYAPHPMKTGRGSRVPFTPPRAVPPSPLERSDFICLEPMVAITNALNLAHRGIYRELQSVPPGGTWQESFWIRPTGFSSPA